MDFTAFVYYEYDNEDDTVMVDVTASNERDAKTAAIDEARSFLTEDCKIWGVVVYVKS